VHSIPGCTKVTPDGKKETIRFFRQVDANFTQWLKNNQDPLWDILDPADKFDRQNNRQDFAVRPLHFLPVWDYEEQDIKLARQGNQFFEEMLKWYDQGGDVTACDWMVYTEGSGRRSSYKSVRQDQSPFQVPVDPQALQQKCQELMTQGLNDLLPFKTEDELIKFVNGVNNAAQIPAGNQQHQLPSYGQTTQTNPPAYTPGGTPTTQYSNVPMGGQPAVNTNQNIPTQYPSPYNPQPQVVNQQPTQVPQPSFVPPTMSQPTVTPQYNNGGYNPQASIPAVGSTSQPPVSGFQPQPPTMGFQPQPPTMGFQPQPPTMGFQPQAPQVARDDVPNAPLRSTQPVYAPPVTTQQVPVGQFQTQVQQPPQPQAQLPVQQNPANIVVDFGKHSGKTLGWILENDRSYLTFLKGDKKRNLGDVIDVLLNSAPQIQQTTQQIQQTTQQTSNTVDESQRENICNQINQKLLDIPDFQGPGIKNNMYPFLMQTIGTTDFSSAPVPDLVKLNQAIDGLVVHQGA